MPKLSVDIENHRQMNCRNELQSPKELDQHQDK